MATEERRESTAVAADEAKGVLNQEAGAGIAAMGAASM
jgi:hypothetical protein